MLWERFKGTPLELYRRVRNALNWRLVRGLGQLQILTRVSYVTLVLIPLFATLWPLVRGFVNQHNQAIAEASRLLDAASSDLNRAIDNARRESQPIVTASGNPLAVPISEQANRLLGDLEKHARQVSNLAENYTNDYSEKVFKTPVLPWSLAAGFFAALFVTLGHLIYQLRAPEQIRSFTWDSFISSRMEDFAKHPTEDALIRAREYMTTASGRRLAESDRYEAEDMMKRLYGRQEDEQQKLLGELPRDKLLALSDWIKSGDSPAPLDHQSQIGQAVARLLGQRTSATSADMIAVENMTVIERGARAEYLRLAGQNTISTLLAALLYGL